MTSQNTAFLSRERRQTIARISMPVVGGMLSQTVINLVDTAMVGMLGPMAVAAVGVGSYVNFIAVAAVIGLSSAVQATVARRVGEGRKSESAVPLNGGLLLALLFGVPLTFLMLGVSADLYALVNDDPAVLSEGVPYFEARLFGVIAIGLNFSFRGYWTGMRMTGIYLRTLLVMHAVNVVINYLLIFGAFGFPQMGAEGAGWGTSISLYVGTLIYFVLAWRTARANGFLVRIPRLDTLTEMIRLALPSALQQLLFAIGISALIWIVGQVGANEVAVAAVLVNLLLAGLLPANALGMAALTLASESLGRKDHSDAARWGWEVTVAAAVILGTLGLLGAAIPHTLLSGFLHDPAVVELGVFSLRVQGVVMGLDAVGIVLMHALLGAGAARHVMGVSIITQWLIGLPLAYLLGITMGWGLSAVWGGYITYRMVQSGIFTLSWARGRWATISI